MDIAVFSDIHSNYRAFQRCIDYVLDRQIDTFIFLGDYVGELAYPQRTMDLLYGLRSRYQCFFVAGNKEAYWLSHYLNHENNWKEHNSTSGALLYAYRNLTMTDLDFFQTLPISQQLHFKELPPITICHGSPEKANEKLLPGLARTYELMEQDESSLILCGHTHVRTKIEHQGKLILNPGSIGLPYLGSRLHSEAPAPEPSSEPSGKPFEASSEEYFRKSSAKNTTAGTAQFLLLHGADGQWAEEFVDLDYDAETVIAELDESGLTAQAPYWSHITKRMLRRGDITHGMILSEVMNRCFEKTGSCNWPDIPEIFWEEAIAAYQQTSPDIPPSFAPRAE